MTALPLPTPEQTKRQCGHSAAAHDTGPCIGINVADRSRDLLRGSQLCACPGMRIPR